MIALILAIPVTHRSKSMSYMSRFPTGVRYLAKLTALGPYAPIRRSWSTRGTVARKKPPISCVSMSGLNVVGRHSQASQPSKPTHVNY